MALPATMPPRSGPPFASSATPLLTVEARPAPGIPFEWVQAYVGRIEATQGARVAREIGRQLTLFLDYAERSQHDATRLPWWEYSLALEWINAHTSGFRLTLGRARRLLDTLRAFYQALVTEGRMGDCADLDQARAVFCGGRRLRLLPRPDRTGAEVWTALHLPDGPLVTFSLADFWLCLLWSHVGRSWPALTERMALVPGGTSRLGASDSLRDRLERAGCANPLRLLTHRSTAADLEDAIRWLSTPEMSPFSAVPEPNPTVAALPTEQLLARLAVAFPGMPRDEMAELIRRGREVVPACLALLASDGYHAVRDPVWTLVVLGELRDPRALATLARSLARDEEGGVAVAAAEALGKLGEAALPVLEATLRSGGPTERLYAYGALGMIPTDAGYERLVAALGRDPELTDVIARALANHGRREAIDVLHETSRNAPAWTRHQLESAIVALLHGPVATDGLLRDWRIRYRRLPGLDWSFPLSWLSIAAITHRHVAETASAADETAMPRPLADLMADVRLRPDERPCLHCGGRRWQPTGLPLCRHTARGLLALQTAVVDRWIAAGHTDPWAALDDCDAIDLRLQRRPSGRPLPRWAEHERDLTAIGRATLYWLLPLSDPRVTLPGVAHYLRVLAQDVARLYGDPHSAPHAVRSARRTLQKFS